MTAQLIDGKALSKQLREAMRARVAALAARGVTPCLTVILVGDDPASQVYVRNKAKACIDLGMRDNVIQLPADTSENELLLRIRALNRDPAVHGILVQLPLPKHLSSRLVIETISPAKDVDGFHVTNVGALATGHPHFVPCTPAGVMAMLESVGVTPWAQHAVVVGASNIVGKPLSLLLLAKGATVTICNSKTRDLAHHTRDADILVAAVGRPGMIRGDMIKPGACVIDVGINRTAEGKLTGDVAFHEALAVAGYLTPVPGGVGPMTITMLLANTLAAAERTAALVHAPRAAHA